MVHPSHARHYAFNGEMHTASGLARIAGCTRYAMIYRLTKWSPEDAVAMGPSDPDSANLKRSAAAKALPTGFRAKTHELDGCFYTSSELAQMAGAKPDTMRRRLAAGMSPAEAVAAGAAITPSRAHSTGGKFWIDGRRATLKMLADEAGVALDTMRSRLKRMTPEAAVRLGKTRPGRQPGSVNVTPTIRIAPRATFAPDAPVVTPANVKRTICPSGRDHRFTVSAPTPFFSAMTPGSYISSDSAISRAYGE